VSRASEQQRAAASERRARVRTLARKVAALPEAERQAWADRAGLRTVEGHALSHFNACLVMTQDPQATLLGGFRQWKKAGRSVRKGERGLALWVPLARAASEPGAELEAADDAKRPAFLLGTVFDVRQTEPSTNGSPSNLEVMS